MKLIFAITGIGCAVVVSACGSPRPSVSSENINSFIVAHDPSVETYLVAPKAQIIHNSVGTGVIMRTDIPSSETVRIAIEICNDGIDAIAGTDLAHAEVDVTGESRVLLAAQNTSGVCVSYE